jgi:hypothetical protein
VEFGFEYSDRLLEGLAGLPGGDSTETQGLRFDVTIPKMAAYCQALRKGKTIAQFGPKNPARRAMESITGELLSRIEEDDRASRLATAVVGATREWPGLSLWQRGQPSLAFKEARRHWAAVRAAALR